MVSRNSGVHKRSLESTRFRRIHVTFFFHVARKLFLEHYFHVSLDFNGRPNALRSSKNAFAAAFDFPDYTGNRNFSGDLNNFITLKFFLTIYLLKLILIAQQFDILNMNFVAYNNTVYFNYSSSNFSLVHFICI